MGAKKPSDKNICDLFHITIAKILNFQRTADGLPDSDLRTGESLEIDQTESSTRPQNDGKCDCEATTTQSVSERSVGKNRIHKFESKTAIERKPVVKVQ